MERRQARGGLRCVWIARARARTHTHTHACIHVRSRTCTRVYIQTHVRTRKPLALASPTMRDDDYTSVLHPETRRITLYLLGFSCRESLTSMVTELQAHFSVKSTRGAETARGAMHLSAHQRCITCTSLARSANTIGAEAFCPLNNIPA